MAVPKPLMRAGRAMSNGLRVSRTCGAPIEQKSRSRDVIFPSAWKSLRERNGRSCGSDCLFAHPSSPTTRRGSSARYLWQS